MGLRFKHAGAEVHAYKSEVECEIAIIESLFWIMPSRAPHDAPRRPASSLPWRPAPFRCAPSPPPAPSAWRHPAPSHAVPCHPAAPCGLLRLPAASCSFPQLPAASCACAFLRSWPSRTNPCKHGPVRSARAPPDAATFCPSARRHLFSLSQACRRLFR